MESYRTLHVEHGRGHILCLFLDDPPRALPLYHGPSLDPKYAHPYFPGTVVPYVRAADYSNGRPVPCSGYRVPLIDHPSAR